MGPTFVSGGVRVSALQSSQISRVLQDWSEEDIEKSFHYSPRYCQLSLLILIYFFDAINELEIFLLKKVCPRCHHRDRADHDSKEMDVYTHARVHRLGNCQIQWTALSYSRIDVRSVVGFRGWWGRKKFVDNLMGKILWSFDQPTLPTL